MRILRIILIFIVVIPGLYLAACLFIPSTYKVERSIEVNAPVDIVFEQIVPFKNWEKWSPEKAKDPKLKSLFSYNNGKVNSYWLWKGQKAGQGRIKATAIKNQKQIAYRHTIQKPFPLDLNGSITLEPQGLLTKIIWTTEGTNPFHLRVLNLLMDKKIGPDFEIGLALLKTIAEKEAEIFQKEYFGYRIKETRFIGSKIGYVKKTVLLDELDEFFSTNYLKLTSEAQNCNFKLNGPQMALYYRWDYTNGLATVAAAIPLKGDSTLGDDFSLMQFSSSKTLLLNYYGGYKSNANAYKALDNFARNKRLRIVKPAIEEYIIGPKEQRDSSKWLTKIYYLIGS